MRRWQRQWGAIGFLALAGAVPVRAAGTLAPGTELIYTGILEKREVQTGVPEIAYRARERLSVLAARMKQAEAIERVVRTAFTGGAGTDRKKQLAAIGHAIAQVRRSYPGSPYAAALTPIEAYLRPEARRLALQDAPAPAFRLKDLAGREQTLGQYRGKILLLCFFASW